MPGAFPLSAVSGKSFELQAAKDAEYAKCFASPSSAYSAYSAVSIHNQRDLVGTALAPNRGCRAYSGSGPMGPRGRSGASLLAADGLT